MSTRRGAGKPLHPLGDASDPQGMAHLLGLFLEWLKVRNHAPRTVESRLRHCNYFIQWVADRGVTQPIEINKPMVERYQRFLSLRRKPNGEPLSVGTQLGHLISLRLWLRWLCRRNHISANPAGDLEMPRGESKLPKHVLTAREAELVLAVPDVNNVLGLRDRAILEVFYSTGIRRTELANLKLFDVDRERGLVMVRLGKGKKDRLVPIGQRALAWLERYTQDVRPKLLRGARSGDALFLTAQGYALRPTWLTQLVAEYIDKAELGKRGSCHIFRHTMATLMLEAGADIRIIQEILGHSNLQTTHIYTRVSVAKLKQVHDATHPARMPKGDAAD